jgi:hypothetical protein
MSTAPTQAAPAYPLTHAPRPAITAPSHPIQRRFGAGQSDAYSGTRGVGQQAATASVYRDSECEHAELQVEVGIGNVTSVSVRLLLDARGLIDLAKRLIDAAHDLEQHPGEPALRRAA